MNTDKNIMLDINNIWLIITTINDPMVILINEIAYAVLFHGEFYVQTQQQCR